MSRDKTTSERNENKAVGGPSWRGRTFCASSPGQSLREAMSKGEDALPMNGLPGAKRSGGEGSREDPAGAEDPGGANAPVASNGSQSPKRWARSSRSKPPRYGRYFPEDSMVSPDAMVGTVRYLMSRGSALRQRQLTPIARVRPESRDFFHRAERQTLRLSRSAGRLHRRNADSRDGKTTSKFTRPSTAAVTSGSATGAFLTSVPQVERQPRLLLSLATSLAERW